MSTRESFITVDNCPVRWKRLAKWREESKTLDVLDTDRKALYEYINALPFTDDTYYESNTLVESVAFDVHTDSLAVGATLTINATVLPAEADDKILTWASSNTAAATVDSTGKVTGVAAGTTNITATANDGSGKTDTCVVTVA